MWFVRVCVFRGSPGRSVPSHRWGQGSKRDKRRGRSSDHLILTPLPIPHQRLVTYPSRYLPAKSRRWRHQAAFAKGRSAKVNQTPLVSVCVCVCAREAVPVLTETRCGTLAHLDFKSKRNAGLRLKSVWESDTQRGRESKKEGSCSSWDPGFPGCMLQAFYKRGKRARLPVTSSFRIREQQQLERIDPTLRRPRRCLKHYTQQSDSRPVRPCNCPISMRRHAHICSILAPALPSAPPLSKTSSEQRRCHQLHKRQKKWLNMKRQTPSKLGAKAEAGWMEG